MEIAWLGHSSFRIKGKSGTVITDPYEDSIGLKFPRNLTADIVTVSHAHSDHNHTTAVKGDFTTFSAPGEYEIGGISLVGVATYHDAKKGQERGKNTAFVIEQEKIRLFHSGDLGHTLSREQLNIVGPIDILFLPVGGIYTIGPQEAVEVINQLEPTVIIPMHYHMPGLADTFAKLAPVDDFLKALGVKSQPQPKYTVTHDQLPEEQTVIILEPKTSP